MRFLEQHDFGASFHHGVFEELDNVVRVSDDPVREFLDADLEGMRAKLIDDIAKFAEHLATHTWRTPSGLQSVPPEWKDQQPKRFSKVVKQLNSLSTAIVADYRALFREARTRLGVNPDIG